MSDYNFYPMDEPVRNEQDNAWYKNRNHIKIPKRAESKRFLDAFYTEQTGEIDPGGGEDITTGWLWEDGDFATWENGDVLVQEG